MYRPRQPFNVPARLLSPVYTQIRSVTKKEYEESINFFCSAKSYGGTERIINDQYVIEDTMEVECYFYPEIVANCRVRLLDDGSEWDIVSPPENIERRNQFLKFKIRRVRGGA